MVAVVGHGQGGGGLLCSTLLQVGKKQVAFEAIALPDLHPEPEVGDTAVTFFQTAGGRTGVPAPRRVRRAPYVQFAAPLAWTTLALTLRADGTSSIRNYALPLSKAITAGSALIARRRQFRGLRAENGRPRSHRSCSQFRFAPTAAGSNRASAGS